MRSRRLRRAMPYLLAGVVVWAGIARAAAEWLMLEPDCAPAEAIAVLAGAGTYLERTGHAAKLYHEGRAPRILLTNDGHRGEWDPETESNPMFVERAAAELLRLGVPEERIVVLPAVVHSTHEEAALLAEHIAEHRVGSLLVVTSSFHTRRARWVFRRRLGERADRVHICGAPPGEQTPGSSVWWMYPRGWRFVAGEYVKGVWYTLRYGEEA